MSDDGQKMGSECDANGPPPEAVVDATTKRRWMRWMIPAVALVVMVAMAMVLWGKLRDDVWAYYTDDEGLTVQVQDKKERMVLWEDPQRSYFEAPKEAKGLPEQASPFNEPSKQVEAAFSADGKMMVLTRWSQDLKKAGADPTGADLYLSTWDGRKWSAPTSLSTLNSPANERGAAFSHDGQYLYFTSDREGGAGGYDVYVARYNGKTWTAVERLSNSVNSERNETGPAPSTDGQRLYFSSDREASTGVQDIYVAHRVQMKADGDAREKPAEPIAAPQPKKSKKKNGKKKKQAPEVIQVAVVLPPIPVFAQAEAVSNLNSDADDVETALTGLGDHVFLASDRDRNSDRGFGLYLSRVVDGKVLAPEKVDVYTKKGNTTDPTVRMEGFDLLFSSDADLTGEAERTGQPAAVAGADAGYRLYRSTTREVIGYTDLSRWELFKGLMRKIVWWIVLAVAALIALIYLLEKWKDLTDLYHKCLAGSAIVHLLLLLFLMYWLIAQQIDGGEQQSPETAVNVDSLVQEELAMESEQALAQVANTTQLLLNKNVQEFREMKFTPTEVVTNPIPIPRKTSDQSLVSDFKPSKASESQQTQTVEIPQTDAPELKELAATELPELQVEELEVFEVATTVVEAADPTKDEFKRNEEAIQQVQSEKLQVTKAQNQKVEVLSDAKAVAASSKSAPTTDTGGQTVNPVDGLEADGSPPELEGSTNQLAFARNLPGKDTMDSLLKGTQLEGPKHDLDAKAFSKYIKKQRGKPSLEVIEQLGGSDATEMAIGRALDWYTDHQEPEGHWDMGKHGGKSEYNTSGVGYALLCYYGWGIKQGDANSKHAKAVSKALDWLVKQQKEDGDLRGTKSQHGMYCHGIATIALCEAYGLTKDPKLKEPAEKAVQFILKAQHSAGGWRYSPGQAGDLSVTGWQYMALHSARMAEIEVPEEAFVKTRKFIEAMSGGIHGGLYSYTGGGKGTPAMTATGMFLRQLDLAPPTTPRMQESATFLKGHMLKANKVDFYYDYYATLALYQHQGPIWREWNENLKEVYVTLQKITGDEKGSWDPKGRHMNTGGRVISTGLAVLSLEVYYRLLPMYGFARDNAKAGAALEGGAQQNSRLKKIQKKN